MKVLMVCLGNICRSPLAEGILEAKTRAKNLDWYIDSAGTGGWHAGENPDERSIKIAKKYGVDISKQRARKIEKADFDNFDLILVMDTQNYRDVLSLAKNDAQREKIKMIMNFSRPHRNEAVPDPYYDNRFEIVYEMLDEACEALLENRNV